MAIAKLSALTANPANLRAKNTGARYCVIFFHSKDESTNKKLVLENDPVKKKQHHSAIYPLPHGQVSLWEDSFSPEFIVIVNVTFQLTLTLFYLTQKMSRVGWKLGKGY